MGRRSGFEGFIRATARAVAAAERERKRSERNHFVEVRRLEREAIRENAHILRVHKAAEKAAKVAYLEGRVDEVSDLNADLEEVIIALSTLLEHTLEFDDSIDFSALKKTSQFEDFKTPRHLLPEAEPELKIVNVPPAWKMIFPWVQKNYQRELQSSEEVFARRKEEYLRKASNQKTELDSLVEEYQKHRTAYFEEIERQHEEVNQFELGKVRISGEILLGLLSHFISSCLSRFFLP